LPVRNPARAVAPPVYSKLLIVGGGARAIKFHLPRLLALPAAPTVYIYDCSPVRQDELRGQLKRLAFYGPFIHELSAGTFNLGGPDTVC
jgi:hypothetical protein